MAATDTIIGIAGAAVLVAVMVGVFVYEYNNVPDDNGTEPGVEPHTVYQNFTGSGTALAGQQLGSHTYALAANATHLHVAFTATGPAGTPAVTLTITLPGGATESLAPCGELMLDAPEGGDYGFTVTADTAALQASYEIRLVGDF
jgi:hypothetical protein